MTFPTCAILEFLPSNIVKMTWEDFFSPLQQKHAAASLQQSCVFQCKQVQTFRKYQNYYDCLFVFEVACTTFCSKAASAFTCYDLNCSSVALPSAQSSLALLAARTNKSERTSDLPRGRKEHLKTSSAFESVCLSLLSAQL